MGGHPGSNHYFAVMRASDEHLMPQNTEEVFEAYLKQAPPEAPPEANGSLPAAKAFTSTRTAAPLAAGGKGMGWLDGVAFWY